MKRVVSSIWIAFVITSLTSCATLNGTKRLLIGAGLGAGAGAIGGTLLSPNDESRGLNALVFGLSGALAGGLAALFTDPKSEIPKASPELKNQDHNLEKTAQEFEVLPNQKLPEFLKNRIQPLVIEEFIETDSITEDGVLHEPHKAYRVKHPGDLFSKPNHSEGNLKQ